MEKEEEIPVKWKEDIEETDEQNQETEQQQQEQHNEENEETNQDEQDNIPQWEFVESNMENPDITDTDTLTLSSNIPQQPQQTGNLENTLSSQPISAQTTETSEQDNLYQQAEGLYTDNINQQTNIENQRRITTQDTMAQRFIDPALSNPLSRDTRNVGMVHHGAMGSQHQEPDDVKYDVQERDDKGVKSPGEINRDTREVKYQPTG